MFAKRHVIDGPNKHEVIELGAHARCLVGANVYLVSANYNCYARAREPRQTPCERSRAALGYKVDHHVDITITSLSKRPPNVSKADTAGRLQESSGDTEDTSDGRDGSLSGTSLAGGARAGSGSSAGSTGASGGNSAGEASELGRL